MCSECDVAFLKSISGHTTCAHAVKRYLEYGPGASGIQAYVDGESRAIGHDFLNLERAEQADWARAMDATRRRFGNDRPHRGLRPVTYRHFIVSPDPADGIDLEALRELTMAWVQRHFASYQVAVTYHDDNANSIPHAHIVVNSTDINTGRRLHFTDRETRALADSLQTLAMERGLRHFDNVEEESARPESVHRLADIVRLRAGVSRTTRDRRPSAQREYISKSEREAASRGVHLWKADIRDRALVAMWLSDGTEASFASELEKLGVRAEFRKDGILYTEAACDTHRVTSARLGADFGRAGLARISTVAALRISLDESSRSAIRDHAARITDVSIKSIGMGMAEMNARLDATGITLRQIDEALDTLSWHGIGSLRQADASLRRNPDQAALAEAVRIARTIGFLPESTTGEAAKAARDAARNSSAAAKSNVPLSVKLKKGWRLTKSEYASLTASQRAAWEAARRASSQASKSKAGTSSSPGKASASHRPTSTQTYSPRQSHSR